MYIFSKIYKILNKVFFSNLAVNEESTVEECCRSRGISQNCLKHCYYNSSLTEECSEFSDFWVQCASDGHDHSKCCIEFGI